MSNKNEIRTIKQQIEIVDSFLKGIKDTNVDHMMNGCMFDITNKDIAGKYCALRLIALWKLIENPIRTIPVCSMIVENFLVIKFFLVTNIKLKIIPPIKAIIGILKKTLRNKKANK